VITGVYIWHPFSRLVFTTRDHGREDGRQKASPVNTARFHGWYGQVPAFTGSVPSLRHRKMANFDPINWFEWKLVWYIKSGTPPHDNSDDRYATWVVWAHMWNQKSDTARECRHHCPATSIAFVLSAGSTQPKVSVCNTPHNRGAARIFSGVPNQGDSFNFVVKNNLLKVETFNCTFQ